MWKVSKQIQPLCFLLTLPSWWYSVNKHMPNYTLVHTSTTRGSPCTTQQPEMTDNTVHSNADTAQTQHDLVSITYRATLRLTTSTLWKVSSFQTLISCYITTNDNDNDWHFGNPILNSTCVHIHFFSPEILYHRSNFDNLFQSFMYLW